MCGANAERFGTGKGFSAEARVRQSLSLVTLPAFCPEVGRLALRGEFANYSCRSPTGTTQITSGQWRQDI